MTSSHVGMKRIGLPLLAVLALAAAGCGSSNSSSSSTSSSSTPPPASTGTSSTASSGGGKTVTIDMKDIQFAPTSQTVKVGQTVKWVNEDDVQHNAVAENDAFKSELFNKGETFTATVDQPGTIKYVCTVHPGMTGELDVK